MTADIRVLLSEENDRLTDTVAKQANEIERLRAALRWYADPAIHKDARFEYSVAEDGHRVLTSIPSSYMRDHGNRARAALKEAGDDL